MKLTKPCFYDDFRCIADRCTDNCCIGWEIDIDEAAMERFSHAQGAFGERLRGAIIHGECPTFANTAGERCALLRQDGLCELVLNMGEDSLCDICALHPRFFEWLNDEKEAGLGLCCEEVCRLLFAQREPLTFVTCDIEEAAEDTCDEALRGLLLSARGQLFEILQRREKPLYARLSTMCCYVRELQDNLDNGVLALPEEDFAECSPEKRRGTLAAFLKMLSECEPINAEWTERITELCRRSGEIARALPAFLAAHTATEYLYEHIAVYTLYRWFMKGAFDGEIVSKAGFSCAAVLAVAAMDCLTWLERGELSEWDRIVNVKLFSKQTEYSDEVMDAVFDALWTEQLAPERLAECLCGG